MKKTSTSHAPDSYAFKIRLLFHGVATGGLPSWNLGIVEAAPDSPDYFYQEAPPSKAKNVETVNKKSQQN